MAKKMLIIQERENHEKFGNQDKSCKDNVNKLVTKNLLFR